MAAGSAATEPWDQYIRPVEDAEKETLPLYLCSKVCECLYSLYSLFLCLQAHVCGSVYLCICLNISISVSLNAYLFLCVNYWSRLC